ncbi:MAG: hypothetical protein E7434_01855 [Ruminococcaceae bacterium]|nr:hypothetical protein [Oscillospiraceae bacterium]
MRCPNCKSEIGAQASCPYCGVVITRSRTYYDYPNSTVATPRPNRTVMQQDVQSQTNITARRLEKRFNDFELKQTMTMILCGGILALQLLLLIVLIIK